MLSQWQNDKTGEIVFKDNRVYEVSKFPYDMFADHDGDYNCTCYSDRILKAGGINFLDGIQTPQGAQAKIEHTNSLMEGLFDAKDFMDNLPNIIWDKVGEIFYKEDGTKRNTDALFNDIWNNPDKYPLLASNNDDATNAYLTVIQKIKDAEENSHYSPEQIEHMLERYFSALSVTQNINLTADAFKYGDIFDQIGAISSLALSIDQYCEANYGKALAELTPAERNNLGLSNEQMAYVRLVASVVGAIQAFRNGDDWDKLAASLQLYNDITILNNKGQGIPGLSAVISAINTYQSIQSFDDALNSGDDMAIAQSGVNLAYNAALTYNAASSALASVSVGAGTQISGTALSYLGYASAALQVANDDVGGGICTAFGTYMMAAGQASGNYYLVAAGVVAALIGALAGEAPPRARGAFYLDENGQIRLKVSGDDEVREAAQEFGSQLDSPQKAVIYWNNKVK